MKVRFFLNGEAKTLDVRPEKRLADLLHDDLGMLSVHTSCNSGSCGSCTVLIGEKAYLSCLIPCFSIQGEKITTFEGFSETKDYKDLLKAFEKHNYSPCGFCMPGKTLAIYALLLHTVDPDENEILEALWGNRCSCDVYKPLIDSVMSAAAYRRLRKRAR